MATTPRQFKDQIYEQVARIGKAMSASKRLELLDLLCQGPRTVESLAKQSNLSIANASQHLKVLRATQLIEAEKHGLFVEYRIADETVCNFFLAMRSFAKLRLSEIEKVTRDYFEQRIVLEPVPRDELVRRVKGGEVTLLDVRPIEEFRAGHLPGAISMPMAELKKRLKDLPKNREIVAYCRGPYCVMAVEVVEFLQKKGFRAHRLEHGVVEWRAHGWRIEKSKGHAHGKDIVHSQ